MINWTPPVSFFFKVNFGKAKEEIPDTSFQEVSGLETSFEFDTVEEGGENNFTHQLPKKVKHGNLVLKRALEPASSPLTKWVKATLEDGFTQKIAPRLITVYLLGVPFGEDKESGAPVLASWQCSNAYPVKWTVNPFQAEKNELVIETLEFCYNELKRLN